jgi:hypothetical protein
LNSVSLRPKFWAGFKSPSKTHGGFSLTRKFHAVFSCYWNLTVLSLYIVQVQGLCSQNKMLSFIPFSLPLLVLHRARDETGWGLIEFGWIGNWRIPSPAKNLAWQQLRTEKYCLQY